MNGLQDAAKCCCMICARQPATRYAGVQLHMPRRSGVLLANNPRSDTKIRFPVLGAPLRPRLRLSWGDGSLRPASHHHAPTGRTLPSHPTTDNYRHSPTHPTHSIDLTGSPPEACGHSHRSHHNTSRTAAATLVHVGLTLWSLSVTDGLTPCSQSACAIVHGCATLCLLVPG